MGWRYLVVSALVLWLAACAGGQSGRDYTRGQVREVQQFRVGTVVSVHPVRIEGTNTQIGTLSGAAVGGIAGSGVGKGRGSQTAVVLGAVVGGLAGAAAEEGLTRADGVEVVIELENGQMVSVVQALDKDMTLAAGDRVRLIESGGVARVVAY